MTEVGYFDTFPTNNNTGFDGAWSVYPYFTSGNIIIGDIDRGLFIVRKGGTLNVENFNLKKTFKISPNPTQSNPTIIADGANTIKSIEVYNILGKKVFEKHNINLQKFVLPIKNHQRGVYLIKINSLITKKLLVK